jgi:anti-sigma factor RsiW
MRYLDGEASEEESREVERWLEESQEARALARDIEAVGAAVRAIADEKGAAGDSIADAVMKRLELPSAPQSLEEHRTRKGAKKPSMLFPAVGFSLAAAAAVVLFLRSPSGDTRGPVAGTPGDPSASSESESAEIAVIADDATGAAIESVDFGAQNGTIFMVPSGLQVTPVVWLVDDGEASEG